jgi:hypothetical protein
MEEVDDADLVVERVAALDLGKAGLDACGACRTPTTRVGACRSCAAMARPPHSCCRWQPGYAIGRCIGS